MSERRYYAVEYAHGALMLNGGAFLAAFKTAQARNQWVGEGNAYVTQRGYREAVKASHPAVRRALTHPDAERNLEEDGGTPIDI